MKRVKYRAGEIDDASVRQGRSGDIAKPFNLLRWFAITSLLAIVPLASLAFVGLSQYISDAILQRDAILTAQFVHNVVETESAHGGFASEEDLVRLLDLRVDPLEQGITSALAVDARDEVLDHLRRQPDLLLANVVAPDRYIAWSTNPALRGALHADSSEFSEALRSGRMVVNRRSGESGRAAENNFFRRPASRFIEYYIPLLRADGQALAMVELYKEPRSLLATIKRSHLLVAVGAVLVTLLTYLALFSIVRRASRLLQAQEQRLVETETLVAIGEMSAAVAHGLRNPLATIRSSAELAVESDHDGILKNSRDIIAQVDRLSKWVRELLLFSQPVAGQSRPVPLLPLLEEVVSGFAAQFDQLAVRLEWETPDDLRECRVLGHPALLTQVFQSVLSNAVEAMRPGGRIGIRLSLAERGRRLLVVVSDTGKGLSAPQMALAFKPFHTTKRNGLGVGLPMVRRIVERFGGSVELRSTENVGTDVRLSFVPSPAGAAPW